MCRRLQNQRKCLFECVRQNFVIVVAVIRFSLVASFGVQGRGIVHAEMPGGPGRMKGLQLWVNLKSGEKMVAPAYQVRQKQIMTAIVRQYFLCGGLSLPSLLSSKYLRVTSRALDRIYCRGGSGGCGRRRPMIFAELYVCYLCSCAVPCPHWRSPSLPVFPPVVRTTSGAEHR